MGKKKASASEAAPVITCRPVLLPEYQWEEAAAIATDTNPVNRPTVGGFVAAEMVPALHPLRIAVLTQKWWGPAGKVLTVAFLDNPTAACKRKILEAANLWNRACNIKYVEAETDPIIRVSREPGTGYASFLGVDNLLVPKGQPTMWLDSFTEKTSDAEYMRVVPHEFWHAAGGPHEHARAKIIALLDAQKTIRVYRRDYGWDERTTREQALTPISERSIRGSPADVSSIMCYQFSSECTKSGKPIPGGLVIDKTDYEWAAKIYPKSL